MVELFNNFTSTLVVVGVILALGIIFEKQLIALEDKFDAYIAALRKQNKAQTVPAKVQKKASAKQQAKKQREWEGFAA